jgi:hypothetical protein
MRVQFFQGSRGEKKTKKPGKPWKKTKKLNYKKKSIKPIGILKKTDRFDFISLKLKNEPKLIKKTEPKNWVKLKPNSLEITKKKNPKKNIDFGF